MLYWRKAERITEGRPPQGGEEYRIERVHERSNAIFRNLPREQRKKVIASNVDVMLIVMSAGKPSFKRGLMDRYLVRSDYWNVPAFVVFNPRGQLFLGVRFVLFGWVMETRLITMRWV